jgi:hypothetical protein
VYPESEDGKIVMARFDIDGNKYVAKVSGVWYDVILKCRIRKTGAAEPARKASKKKDTKATAVAASASSTLPGPLYRQQAMLSMETWVLLGVSPVPVCRSPARQPLAHPDSSACPLASPLPTRLSEHRLQLLGSLGHTPPQVGHGFLNLCLWGLTCPRGSGKPVQKVGGVASPPFGRVPRASGQLGPQKNDLENHARHGVGYVPSCPFTDITS